MSQNLDPSGEEALIRQDIVQACSLLHGRNMLASADGNISFRISDSRILMTPSGINKAFMGPEDMAVVNLNGDAIEGKPSSEKLMHLEVYKRCPKARCVVHAHPPTAVAWTIGRPHLEELPADCISEVILAVGRIPIVPYARPGTQDMGSQLGPFLPDSRVMILARHGAISWGEDLMEAYNGMERLEHSAQILMAAQNMGRLHPLPAEEVAALRAMRTKMGERTR